MKEQVRLRGTFGPASPGSRFTKGTLVQIKDRLGETWEISRLIQRKLEPAEAVLQRINNPALHRVVPVYQLRVVETKGEENAH